MERIKSCVICFDDVEWNCQMISKAKELSAENTVVVIVLGKNNSDVIQLYKECGASILLINYKDDYSQKFITDFICQINNEYEPTLYMLPACTDGKELASRMAIVLELGLVAECIDLVNEKSLTFTRTTNSASKIVNIVCINSRASICTVRKNVFEKKFITCNDTAIVKYYKEQEKHMCSSIKSEIIRKDSLPINQDIDFKKAKIIIGLGRGVSDPIGINNAMTLSNYFGAEIGVTRTVVEQGNYGRERQIGQSGEIVNPRIYIALGISGAIQHMIGLEKAGIIIAVNHDPNAPIFNYADYSIVEDCNIFLQKMVDSLESSIKGFKDVLTPSMIN